MTGTDPVLNSQDEFAAEYTAKDLILYALALGFGSSEKSRDEELRFLFEDHVGFTAVPTFCLVLSFWADRGNRTSSCSGIQSFPPPMMRSMGVIPKQLLRVELPSELPVLHTYQSITWHHPLPIPSINKDSASSVVDSPISVLLASRFVSVAPKTTGTFVTTETVVCLRSVGSVTATESTRLCTLESTALILGFPPEHVIPYQNKKQAGDGRHRSNAPDNRAPDFEWTFSTTSTQALLYRVASGDTNAIHVDPYAASLLGGSESRPLLHGLCTLGIAMRAILQYPGSRSVNPFIQHLAGQFVKPVFVGDRLGVRIWPDKSQPREVREQVLFFTVHNMKTEETVVARGRAEVRHCAANQQPSGEATPLLKSNL